MRFGELDLELGLGEVGAHLDNTILTFFCHDGMFEIWMGFEPREDGNLRSIPS